MDDIDDVALDTRGAEDDLAWYFGNAERVLGLHAQSYEGSGSGADSDPHLHLQGAKHRDDMARLRRVEAVFEAGPKNWGARRVLEQAHQPCGWSAQHRKHFTRKVTKVCLLPLALSTAAARKACAKRYKRVLAKWSKTGAGKGEPPPTEESVADFLFWEAGLADAELRLAAIVEETVETFEAALHEFALVEVKLLEASPAVKTLVALFGADRVTYGQGGDHVAA